MTPFYWLNEDSRQFLARDYLPEGLSPEQRIKDIAWYAESLLGIEGFAEKFERYMSYGWYSLSSPIWSNFGNSRGLSISCNGSYVADRMDSILAKAAEIGMMTKYGAGTSAYLGDLRPRGNTISVGGKSNGAVHFAELFDTVTSVISQSNIRRGACAVYLPVTHPDIYEFLSIRDAGSNIQGLSIGVCISDQFMQDMLDGNKEYRKIWARIIQKRFESGYPYLFFSDAVNKNAPQVYKDKGMKIHASNLCAEIALSSSEEESFVCNLSSMNALYYDEWRDTDAVFVLTCFLDAVMSDYIHKTENIDFMQAAHRFAKRQRALGIGTLGWHSYLQSKMIPFESMTAKMHNVQMWRYIKEQSQNASQFLAAKFGEPELLKGYGLRNVTTMAIAPTTSSSFILGQVSPSIEPLNSNYFIKDLAKGKFTYKNPYLEAILEEAGSNTSEIWRSILTHGGSIQHLDLPQEEKDVFKTFGEISQKEVIIQAIQRQGYVDQSQSTNIMVHPKESPKNVSQLLIYAWEQGIKTLYYQRNTNPAQELSRNLLDCISCES